MSRMILCDGSLTIICALYKELEYEREKSKMMQRELEVIQKFNGKLLSVSGKIKKQLEDSKQLEENQKNEIFELRSESEKNKNDINVMLAYSAALSLTLKIQIGKEIMLLAETRELKKTLEEEINKHEKELKSLQKKFEAQENYHIKILEERLKIIEFRLEGVINQVERAEGTIKFSHSLLVSATSTSLPPPPPPPLPTLTLPMPIRIIKSSALSEQNQAGTSSVQSKDSSKMAKKGLKATVNDDVINAIKQGNFTLKKTKNKEEDKENERPRTSEFLSVRCKLKQTPNKRQSQLFGDALL